MKRNYQKPKMHVVKIQHSGIICTSPGGGSGWGVIGTDQPNLPPGAPHFDILDVWDE